MNDDTEKESDRLPGYIVAKKCAIFHFWAAVVILLWCSLFGGGPLALAERLIEFPLPVLFFCTIGPLIWWLMWREDTDGMRSEVLYAYHLAKRDAVDAHSFYLRYYADSDIEEELVRRFRRFQANFWGVKEDFIRPWDDYIHSVGGGSANAFVLALEKEFGFRYSDTDPLFKTLFLPGATPHSSWSFDTLLRYVAKKLENP